MRGSVRDGTVGSPGGAELPGGDRRAESHQDLAGSGRGGGLHGTAEPPGHPGQLPPAVHMGPGRTVGVYVRTGVHGGGRVGCRRGGRAVQEHSRDVDEERVFGRDSHL